MPKYGRWGETVSSSSGSDSENGEQLQGTYKGNEEKVTKILNLIKSNGDDEKEQNSEEKSQVKSQLVELIEDFHGDYKSLHALYDQLREELSKIEIAHEKGESSSSSSLSGSNSESEYYSPDEVSSRGSASSKSVKRVFDLSNSEEATPTKPKLLFSKENEDIHLEYKEAMIRNQELKKMICDLEFEAEQRHNIIKAVKDESAQLKEKLLEREKNLETSIETHKAHENEVLAWKKTLESQIDELRDELRIIQQESERKTVEINQLGKENSEMQNQVSEHEKISKGKEQKLSIMEQKLEDDMKVLNLKNTALVKQINSLELEVETLNTQKGKLEKELESKTNEASAQLKTLMEKSEKEKLVKEDQIQNLHNRIIELENTLKERDEEAKALQQKIQNEGAEASNQYTSVKEDFNKLKKELNKLKKEFDALQTENSQLEWKFAREKQRSLQCLTDVKTQNTELTTTIEEQQLTLKEKEDTINTMIKVVDDFKSKLQNSEKRMTEFAEEFCKKLEVKTRLLSQRLHVAEQLHTENVKGLKKAKDKYLQEREILLLYRSNEANKVNALENVLKEKEMEIEERGEEKREAIRQLCMLIDYHRVRYDRLKDWMLKLNVRNQRSP